MLASFAQSAEITLNVSMVSFFHLWLRWRSHQHADFSAAVHPTNGGLLSDYDQHSAESSGNISTFGANKLDCKRSVSEDDLFSILLDLTSLDFCKMEKLEWLRTQLIGDRMEFPTPFGKRQLLYVDQAASGRSLLFIENLMITKVLPYYGNTHTEDSFVGRRISSMVRESASYIKKRLGGNSNDALLFCGAGSTAALKRLQEVMGIAIPSTLRSPVLEKLMRDGDAERCVVFTGPYEHHSNLLSWRQSLAEVIEIPADSEGFVDLAALESALKSPMYRSRRLKLGSFSACSNVTGLITDSRAIARLLHDHGAFACFDFAASAPHIDIDMRSGEKDGYDAVVLSPHKFVGGPGTPGILLLSKSLYMLGNNPPSTCGGGTVAYVNGFSEKATLYHENIEEREDAGTPAIVQKIRCALAFWVKELIGSSVIEQREAFYIGKALNRLSANPNIWILGSTTAKRAPILSFMVRTVERKIEEDGRRSSKLLKRVVGRGSTVQGKPLHGRFVVKLLNDLFGIQARGGCACAGPYGHTLLGVGRKQSLELRSVIQKGYEGLKPGWARVSFCYDMAEDEVEYLLRAIEMVAKYGQRFLPLYEFDWRAGDWTSRDAKEEATLRFWKNGGDAGSDEVMEREFPEAVVGERMYEKRRDWLRKAKAMAHLLTEFPPSRPIPPEISENQVLFRV